MLAIQHRACPYDRAVNHEQARWPVRAAALAGTSGKGVHVDSARRTAFVAGLFYLITFGASIPAVFLLAPALTSLATSPALVPTRGCCGAAFSTWLTRWPASAPPWRCSRWPGDKTKRPANRPHCSLQGRLRAAQTGEHSARGSGCVGARGVNGNAEVEFLRFEVTHDQLA